ncbi:MAG: Ig-like domain-containing protein [Thermoanaerobaculia bacterium]
MTRLTAARTLLLSAILAATTVQSLHAEPLATDSLEIRGMALVVLTTSLDAQLGSPSYVLTEFGGKQDDAPVVEGLVAEGDLVGPDFGSPITLRTAPGHRFEIPGLMAEGQYYLQNIRLVRDGEFVATAIPSACAINVSNKLKTSVTVRQLTADELRERGIVVDARNFDVYEYTFTFILDDGTPVVVPYTVVVDPRTHQMLPITRETPYKLPPVGSVTPPRWTPPAMLTFSLDQPEAGSLPPAPPDPRDPAKPSRPSIPAALVIPGNLAVLHQFFAVSLNVANGADTGSPVELENVSATIHAPSQLRVEKSEPSVASGQAVPILGPGPDANVLTAQQQGDAEWTVEGLSAGTYTVNVDVRATMTQPGQPDLALKGTKSAAVVIHDPRFNITFSHPSSVFAATDWSSDANAYSAYAFVTNMSSTEQTVVLSVGDALQDCSHPQNICLVDPAARSRTLTIGPGQMDAIEYRLKSSESGSIFASSSSASGGAIAISFQLTSGEGYSPATLVMPWYARYLDQGYVNANLELLGRGYGIATAPLTSKIAEYPRVITTDVFARAIDIARAGQRCFITESLTDEAQTRVGKRFAFANLALDLLGARDGRRVQGEPLEHRNALHEWDALRRMESQNNRSGRNAGAALARQLEATIEPGDNGAEAFGRFAAANAHRSDFVAALVGNGARISFASPAGRTVGANDAGSHVYARGVPFADIHRLRFSSTFVAELGLVGHATSNVDLVVSADGPFELQLVYPGGAEGAPLRLSHYFFDPGPHTYTLRLVNGSSEILARNESGVVIPIATPAALAVPSLSVFAARQDLYLDAEGHKISLLFNRPVLPGDGDLFSKFAGDVVFVDGAYSYKGPRPIPAAALQEDGRIIHLTFDHALHTNVASRPGCSYAIRATGALRDPISGAALASYTIPPPRIDNDRPAAIFYGRVIAGDGTPIKAAEVTLHAGPPQYDTTNSEGVDAPVGAFFFEYMPRDPENGYSGAFRLQAVTSEGKSTSTSGTIAKANVVYPIDLQFLGRGSAEGYVRYVDTNAPVAGARVVVGSRMFGQFRATQTDADGFYRVNDVPVGPLTFSAMDADGNVVYAASEIAQPGEVAVQNLLIHRQPFPGLGTVRGIVRRSDAGNDPIPGAHVGVFSQGFGLIDGYTDATGRFEFSDVPAGFVTVLAEEWTVAYESKAIDFDLRGDETKDVTLILPVRGQGSIEYVRIEDRVTRSDAGVAGPVPVPGALVQIDGYPVVTADATGKYVYESVPQSFSGRRIRAYDPETKRFGESFLGTLQGGTNGAPIHIPLGTSGGGRGTVRVLLVDVAGAPVSSADYRVLQTGYPIDEIDPDPTETGVFVVRDVPVGTSVEFVAVPVTVARDGNGNPTGRYGEQYAFGSARVDVDQQVVSRTVRLPGQGQLHVSLVSSGLKQLGDVELAYSAWDDVEQDVVTKTRRLSTLDAASGTPGFAKFLKVPAQQNVTVSATLGAQGNASASQRLNWEGQLLQVDLQLGTRARVRGRVLHFDGITPIAGAAVRISGIGQDPGPQYSAADGSFEFADAPPATGFRLTADWYDNGAYRTGFTTGNTPQYGGVIEGMVVTLRRQANVEGEIVDAAGAPIARAEFWLHELDFPNRSFGSPSSPLRADLAGRFVIANLIEGPFRVTAKYLEQTASLSGRVELDSVPVAVVLTVGTDGAGSVRVRVINPNPNGEGISFTPVASAEVTLRRDGKAFDFASTDAAGEVVFTDVPARGAYSVSAYSKALGNSGSSLDAFEVVADASVTEEIFLQRSGKVIGTLTDAAAQDLGVVGAHIDLAASGYNTRTTSAAGGAFLFDGVREGLFRLETRDPLSNRRAEGQGEITSDVTTATVDLALPRWASLQINTWLPDDYGARSSTSATASVDVKQLCYGGPVQICEELRSNQGSAILFDKVLPGTAFVAEIQELGGGGRRISPNPSGQLAAGEHRQLDLVLPAYGRVSVRVINQATREPMESVRVSVSGPGGNFTGYTDATGSVLAGWFELNKDVRIHATSVTTGLSSGTTGRIERSSVPLEVVLELKNQVSISGYVEAELGGPSTGTRVVAQGSIEILTDGAGRFTIPGFVTGNSVSLVYFGPDGLTVGARQSFTPTGTGVNEVPPVKLDATPPRILGIAPASGATEIPLDATIEIVFSEQIAPSSLSAARFSLAPVGSPTPVALTFSTKSDARGYVMTLNPPDLLSHTLYRLEVSEFVADMSGLTLGTRLGFNFTTADKSEPQIIRVSPDPLRPAPVNSLFEVELNERLQGEDWQSDGAGRMTLTKLSGEPATPTDPVAGTVWLDIEGGRILRFSPSAQLQTGSRYRLEITGIRDLQGNVLAKQTIDFATADAVKPYVAIKAPTTLEPLVEGLLYTTQLDLLNTDENGQPTATPATDIDRVEYFQKSGETWQIVQIVKKNAANPGCAYAFTVPSGATTFSLRAIAYDTSFNASPQPSDVTWTVEADVAPQNVNIVTNVGGATVSAAQAGSTVDARLSFEEKGFIATYTMKAVAVKDGLTLFTAAPKSGQLQRQPGEAWPVVPYSVTLPKTLPAGTVVTFSADVTDSRSQKGTGATDLTILADTEPPVVTTITSPTSGQIINEVTYAQLSVVAVDAEVGVESVTATLGSTSVVMAQVEGTNEFRGQMLMPDIATTEDAAFEIAFIAEDFGGNKSVPAKVGIFVHPNFDPTAPVVSWLCGTDLAMLPVGESLALKVYAVPGSGAGSNPTNRIAEVRFYLGDDPAAVPFATKPYDASNLYAATVSIPDGVTPGQSFVVVARAITAGGKEGAIRSGIGVVTGTNVTGKVIQSNDSSYENASIYVVGGSLTIVGPHRFANVIVLPGGTITHFQGDELTLTSGGIFVACDGAIDVTGRGYGSDATHPEAATKSTGGSGGSHIGRGGDHDSYGEPGATFGSVTSPQELGSGGGSCSCGGTPTAGGGRVRLRADTIALDGAIRANGADPKGGGGPGSGGSVWVTAGILGGAGTVEARTASGWAAGGGGAIAIEYSAGSLSSLVLNAQGQDNYAPSAMRKSGAGTVWVKGPDSVNGVLTIDNRGVPVGQATELPSMGSGTAASIGTNAPNGAVTFVTNRTANIPSYFIGHWVEIRTPQGLLRGTWRVDSIDHADGATEKITLRSDAGSIPAVEIGDVWQGVYRFDALNAPSAARLVSQDPIRIGSGDTMTIEGPESGELTYTNTIEGDRVNLKGNLTLGPIVATTVSVEGNVQTPSVTAANLTVEAGAKLSHAAGSESGLVLDVAQTLTLEEATATQPAGAIDVSGKGYAAEQTLAGHGFALRGSGGSHIGEGGYDEGAGHYSVPGQTYGSLAAPAELGGGGGYTAGARGGGSVKLTAGTLELGGSVRANGGGSAGGGAGAGGSVWIVADTISGDGGIEASGGSEQFSGGGGGAVAVECRVCTSGGWLTNLNAKGRAPGGYATNANRASAAGTILLKRAGSSFGELTIDNGNVSTSSSTRLPALGRGTVGLVSGNTITLNETKWIAPYMKGHWVEVRTQGGTPRGRWKIASIQNANVLTEPRAMVRTRDNAAYSGYFIISSLTLEQHFGAANVPTNERGRRVFAARHVNGTWEFDNDSTFISFTPHESDRVIGTFTKVPDLTTWGLTKCAATGCGSVNGIPLAEVASGRMREHANMDGTLDWNEFIVMGIVVPLGAPSLTLQDEAGSPVAVEPGDSIQGIYQFDLVDLKPGAKFASPDPVYASNFGPPSGFVKLAENQSGTVLAGATINIDVSAEDAQALARVVLKVSGPVGAGSTDQSKLTGSVVSYTTQFQVIVSTEAVPGDRLSIWAEIYDAAGAMTTTSALDVFIDEDIAAPVINSVAVFPAAAGLRYPAGTAVTISVDAVDNVKVTSVSIEVGGAIQTDSTPPFQFAWTTPGVPSETAFELRAIARDARGLESAPSLTTITVTPVDGGAPPQVAWAFPTPNTTVAAGYPIRLGINASDDVGVIRVEFYEEGAAQPFAQESATNTTTKAFVAETSLTLPSLPGPRIITVRVYDISPVFTESQIQVESVSAIWIDSEAPNWDALAGMPRVLDSKSGELVVDGARSLAGLFVLSGASVRPPAYAAKGAVTPLDLTISGPLWIERGASINASDMGYDGTVSRYAKSWWPSSADTSYNGGGGSHGGRGGDFLQHGGYAGRVYGSVYAPTLAGSAGSGRGSSVNCTSCSPGGGVVTIRAQRVVLDGSVTANGGNGADAGGAAGGSVWIKADEILGSGTISAIGGQGHAGGGGGRIALDAPSIGLLPSNVTARTGRNSNESFRAAPGTVWMRGTGTYGTLLVSDEDVDPLQATELPALGSGVALAGSGTTNPDGSVVLVVDREIPSFFHHHFVEVLPTGGSAAELWRIKAIENLQNGEARLTLESAVMPAPAIIAGDAWRGVYHFDALTLVNGAGIGSGDRIYVSSQLFEATCVTATVAGQAAAGETVWFDDALPAGAVPSGTWSWTADQRISGGTSHFEPHNAGNRQHYFDNATARLDVGAGDTLFTYVLIDPCDPPREIMLQFNDGNWDHRAYWGENLINYGTNGTASRRSMGALPEMGHWIRLEVPASVIGVEGTQLKGMAFTLYGGKAWFDRTGRIPPAAP